MRVPRLYLPAALRVGQVIELPLAQSHHLRRVLRLRLSEPLALFNGGAREYRGRLVAMGSTQVSVVIDAEQGVSSESPLAITLAQALARAERMDFTIQKSVELGVQRLVPLLTERSVVRFPDERRSRRMEHWRKIIIGACEQSGRLRLPELQEPKPFAEWITQLGLGSKLMLDPGAGLSLASITSAQPEIVLLVGGEGGFCQREKELAKAAGFIGAHLGPRVLRTETAALVAVSLLQSRFGDLA
ncbi:MAG: 16S rRNA (uracil(1498)-N(3))-methyltransferase [Gammaproteobacteria bacterium]